MDSVATKDADEAKAGTLRKMKLQPSGRELTRNQGVPVDFIGQYYLRVN